MTKWDDRFLKIAAEVASWSKDPSTQVGSVIVSPDKRILATGYNGYPSGVADNYDGVSRDERLMITVHSEMNAILNAAKHGIKINDATLYVHGMFVCCTCAKHIASTGIKRVVCQPPSSALDKRKQWEKEWNEYSLPVFKKCNVETVIAGEEKMYTEEDVKDWYQYELVRTQGMFNMLSQEAQRTSNLTPEKYNFCIRNYDELKKQFFSYDVDKRRKIHVQLRRD